MSWRDLWQLSQFSREIPSSSPAPDSSYTQQKSLAVRTTINHTILLTKILNYELNHNLIPKPYQTRRFILLREHKKMYNILYKYLYHGKSIRYVLYSKDHQNSKKTNTMRKINLEAAGCQCRRQRKANLPTDVDRDRWWYKYKQGQKYKHVSE